LLIDIMIHYSEFGELLLERRFDTDTISSKNKPLLAPPKT